VFAHVEAQPPTPSAPQIMESMYFAIETFAGHPGLRQACRLEENVLVTGKGPVAFILMERMEEAMTC